MDLFYWADGKHAPVLDLGCEQLITLKWKKFSFIQRYTTQLERLQSCWANNVSPLVKGRRTWVLSEDIEPSWLTRRSKARPAITSLSYYNDWTILSLWQPHTLRNQNTLSASWKWILTCSLWSGGSEDVLSLGSPQTARCRIFITSIFRHWRSFVGSVGGLALRNRNDFWMTAEYWLLEAMASMGWDGQLWVSGCRWLGQGWIHKTKLPTRDTHSAQNNLWQIEQPVLL